jgi:hypothetical protein
MKTSELTGELLDYWVGRANGWVFGPPHKTIGCDVWRDSDGEITGVIAAQQYKPSTDWAHGGPIIEREKLYIRDPDPLERHVDSSLDNKWEAAKANHATRMYEHHQSGETPLLAAMRCYVSIKFGDEVPDTETA